MARELEGVAVGLTMADKAEAEMEVWGVGVAERLAPAGVVWSSVPLRVCKSFLG
jgi:hypothetical protein